MSQPLKSTFLVHTVVAAVFGALFLLIPGRFLSLIGWAPIDPIISRLLGAALLALAWSSHRAWRTPAAATALLVELEAVFCLLASVALLRYVLIAHWPWYVWFLFVLFAAFAAAWTYDLILIRRSR